MTDPAAVLIRPYRPGDQAQVLALAPRLTEWVAPWRDPAAVRTAVHDWVRQSVSAAGQPGHAVYVAEDAGGIAGLVTVSERAHFTGQVDAYVGELAVRTGAQRRGIARRLMAAAEAWAGDRGLAFLTLETGAANQPARQLYRSLGFLEEDVRLTKNLRSAGTADGAGA
jgi:ribosomal protein S18 acetylase RimI-like enzyme